MPKSNWTHRNLHGRVTGPAGVALRKRRLKAEPLCRHCRANGVFRVATVPDHIVPLFKGGQDVDANIQCLCARCHEAKTALDMGRRLRPITGMDGWPLD